MNWTGSRLNSWSTSLRPKFRPVCDRNTKQAKPGVPNNEEKAHSARSNFQRASKKWPSDEHPRRRHIVMVIIQITYTHAYFPQRRWMGALKKTRKMCLECLLEQNKSLFSRRKALKGSHEGDEWKVFKCLALNQHNAICESLYDKQIQALTG